MNGQADSAGTEDDTQAPRKIRRSRRNFVWLMVHVIVYLPFRIWCRTRTVGAENLDPDRGGVLLINHQSFLDPLFVAVRLTRPVSFIARDTLFKLPFIGWLCRSTFVIPVSRTAFRGGSIRAALERLEQGFLVGIYPEGTRSSGPPDTFRPGFLSLVRRTDAPVYPVAVVGADKAMPKGAWFVRPAAVKVVYGQALTTEEKAELNSQTDDKVLAELIRQKVVQLYNEPQQSSQHRVTIRR